jgi:hypothetical protein
VLTVIDSKNNTDTASVLILAQDCNKNNCDKDDDNDKITNCIDKCPLIP